MFRLIQTKFPRTRLRISLHPEGRRGKQINLAKLVEIAKTVRQTFFVNILILRESAGFIYRRLCDLYRTGYFAITQERFLTRNRQFLLGACMVSFAQDMISEEEMIATAEGFDISKYNKLSSKSSQSTNSVGPNSEIQTEAPKPYLELNTLQGPITLYIRELRKTFLARQHAFFANYLYSTPVVPVDYEIPIDEPPVAPKVKLAEIVGHISPDGSQFVDDSWEMMINRPHLHMWRRPSSKRRMSQETPRPQNTVISSYEYRVCGSFLDISAYTFLEVQLNLAYRRKWDKSVDLLETVRGRNGAPDPLDQTEIIRWVSKFPFPMARREYVYARRWWAELFPENCSENHHGFALIISRAVLPPAMMPKNSEDKTSSLKNVSLYTESPNYSTSTGIVSVKDYESNMLIRSHNRFDEPGLDYFLSYSDDPQLSVSQETASRLSSTVIPRLLDQLHKAALTLTNKGFPDDVFPVVVKPMSPKEVARPTEVPQPEDASFTDGENVKEKQTRDVSESRRAGSKRSSSSSSPPLGFFTDIESLGAKSYEPFIS